MLRFPRPPPAFNLPPIPISLPHLPKLTPRFPAIPSFPRCRPVHRPLTPLLSSTTPPPPRPPTYTAKIAEDDEPPPRKGLLSLYLHLLKTSPLLTNVVTSGFINSIADILTQLFASRNSPNKKLNGRRLLAMFLVGALLTGPMFHYFYAYLESTIPSISRRNVILQVLVDQLIMDPIWLALFLPALSILEGEKDILKGFGRQYKDGLKTAWAIFPLVQVVNFAVVPLQYRILVINVVDLLVTSVLSWIKHRDS